MTFTASQTVLPAGIGFLWNARVTVAPGVHVQVLDALVDCHGTGRVCVLSAITLASDGNTLEINSGALHRFLAEVVWYPTALLPSKNLLWNPVDSNTAIATLTAGGVTVSLEFRFNAEGEIVGIYSPGRWGKFGGSNVQKPWEGHFRDYVTIQCSRVPKHGEVGWYDEGVWQRVWKVPFWTRRASLTGEEYPLAKPGPKTRIVA